MVLQQDKGAPPPFDTGLPRAQSQEDVPRWLVIIGMVAACTLLVALLRYAIDLLGVVFLIILVGFSIRAVSDWLTEGESVSAWALGAVFAGLFGTVVVALWLFGSRDFTAGGNDGSLPAPIATATDWLEAHGWGQRVLLSGGGLAATPPVGQGGGSTASASGAEPSSPASTPISPPRGMISSEPSRGRLRERRSAGIGEAEAAPLEGGPSTMASASTRATKTRAPSDPGSAAGTAASAESSQDAPSVETTVSLSSSQPTSVVGTSVRFTATVTSDGAPPSGVVIFYDGSRPMATLPVRGTSATATVSYSSLDLEIGDHQVTAVFHGTHALLGSRSDPLTQSVTRR